MNTLKHTTSIEVKFSEADPLGIVWHGHYIRYFEDGREAFGKEYGVGYLSFYENGYVIPVVNVQCDYKKSLRYGDTVIIETEFIPTEAAKMLFKYRLFNSKTNDIVATGSSIQVFLDKNGTTLQLATPEFFDNWKKKYGLSNQ
ncbi:MAG: acyl-CoA thioesterase [Bacteroidetes bacterium]|nr:acyl-CoA thioesterase [Bacteroidota bacterium]